MKKNVFLKVALVMVLSVTTLLSFSQKQVTLKYNLNEGNSYKFETNTAQEISFEANGQSVVMDMVIDVFMTGKVDKVYDSLIDNSFVMDRIKLDQKIFGMEMKYDSDDSSTFSSGAGAQIAQQFNKIIGSTVNMTITEYGSVKNVDLGELVDNDDLSQSFKTGSFYANYPQHPVKVGDSWDVEIKPFDDGDMKVVTTYTLEKANRKEAVISFTGKISGTNIKGEGLKMDGESTGEMKVNAKTGMLISSTSDIDMKMDLEQQGMKIPATVMGTTTTKVEEK